MIRMAAVIRKINNPSLTAELIFIDSLSAYAVMSARRKKKAPALSSSAEDN